MMDVFGCNLMTSRCCFDDLGDGYAWTSMCYYGIVLMTWMIVMLGCNGLEIDIEHFSLSRCCLDICTN